MFNKEMLILAREFRGYTQKELVEKLQGVSQGHLSKLELGIHKISESVLEQIAKVLEFPVAFFYQDKQHYGLPLSINGNFRKKQSLSKKSHLQIKGLINIILHNVEDMLSQCNSFHTNLLDLDINYQNSNKNQDNPKKISDPDKKLIKDIVISTKNHLKIDSNSPIDNLVKSLEVNSILVIDVDFGSDLVDGFSYWINNIPVIFVSRSITGDRQRFTIAHELAHLVLHKNYFNGQMEAEADYFASEFLMPESSIKQDLSYVTLEKLAMLKSKWKVSMASLLFRAKELTEMTEYLYRGLFINMSKCGYRKAEPILIHYENPEIIKSLAKEYKGILPLGDNNTNLIYGIN